MVFHEIDSITDVISGHRIIIYFIESECCGSLSENYIASLKTILETLEKKNDDLLLVKVVKNSDQFRHFQYIYHPKTCGGITLFVINNEGIPITSLYVESKKGICEAVSTISRTCGLKTIPNIESLLTTVEVKLQASASNPTNIHNICNLRSDMNLQEPVAKTSSEKFLESSRSIIDAINELNTPVENNPDLSVPESNFTQLQIRLPDGSKDVQQFEKEAILNEVKVYITSKHKLRPKDFDLKTFNRHNFSEDEYEKTLLDLNLHPNGVIIVVLNKHMALNKNNWMGNFVQTGVRQLITSTSSIILSIQNFILTFWMRYFAPSNSDRNVGRSLQSRSDGSQPTNSQRKSKRNESNAFGNIHTLKRNDESDDENNRYNGNSTQQK